MQVTEVVRKALAHLAPPPPLTVSEHAEKFRYVASGPKPGKWRNATTPYLVEIMDCLTDPLIEKITFKKATRMSGTEFINNGMFYFIRHDPCNILYGQTSLDEGRKYTESIFTPMVEATPVLRDLILSSVGRKATTTKLYKSFPGGSLVVVGSRSPKGFRMLSFRIVIVDDADGWEETKEGDSATLAFGRADEYYNRKLIMVSSPTTEGVSRIDASFNQSDMRFWNVPCPLCDKYQVLKWGGSDFDYGIKWESGKPETVHYICEHCRKKIYDYQKRGMSSHGRWKATAPFDNHAGFQISKLYHPFSTWEALVRKYRGSKGHPLKRMVFVNHDLGEVWKEGKVIQGDVLYERREEYGPEIPRAALILTCGVDTQDDRLEAEVIAYGRGGLEDWGIEKRIFLGSPAEDKVWQELDRFLAKMYRHESGIDIPITCTGIDSGGHYTSRVYEFTKPREDRGIFAVKGSNIADADILAGRMTTNNAQKARLQNIGVTACKDMLFGRMVVKRPGPGYMHFPMTYDKEFFKQITAERAVVNKKGKREYKVIPGRRNEALDIRNYAYGALHIALTVLGIDWDILEKSLASGGSTIKVFQSHGLKHQDGDIKLDPQRQIIVCVNFNASSCVWELCQTDGKKLWAFDEVVMIHAETTRMGREVLKRYGKHAPGFVVCGPEVDRSEYGFLAELGFERPIINKKSELRNRVNAILNMLEDVKGITRFTYHPSCIMLGKDFMQTVWKDDGTDLDRASGRGAAVDALGYYIEYKWPLRSSRPDPNKRFYK